VQHNLLKPPVRGRGRSLNLRTHIHPSSNDRVQGATCRALVVDRDSMSSNLLATTLAKDKQLQASAAACDDLMNLLAAGCVDLVVLSADVECKSGNGSDLAHVANCAYPHLLIVMLLTHTLRNAVINAFRSGARGVFSREQPMADLLDCIEQVKRGCLWVRGQTADYLLQAFKGMPAPDLAMVSHAHPITDRELEVVRHAATGKTNKVIATALRLSEHTIKNYLFRAFEKLGVLNRIGLLCCLTLRGHTFAPSGVAHSGGD